MAKSLKTWMVPPRRPPKPKTPKSLKVEVSERANKLVETELKPRHVKPPPKKPRFNYIIDITTRWYRNYFYFVAVYASPGPTAISPTFELKFARLEYVGEERFALSYLRHNDKWFELFPDLSLDECLEAVRDQPHFLG